MSKDYKAPPQRSSNSKGSPFWTGLLIGLLLGVGITVAVTIKITGGENPLTEQVKPRPEIPISKKAEIPPEEVAALPQDENPNPPDEAKEEKHYDFYNILPGTENSTSGKNPEDAKNQKSTTKHSQYFLQTGSFQDETDADNLKAKLALQGYEAIVQTVTIPEKGVWHRVRVGPYASLEQTNKFKDELTNNGFRAELVEIKGETTD